MDRNIKVITRKGFSTVSSNNEKKKSDAVNADGNI